jgi:hypothetical protein
MINHLILGIVIHILFLTVIIIFFTISGGFAKYKYGYNYLSIPHKLPSESAGKFA